MISMINLGIIASGSGTNAESIIKACKDGILKGLAKVTILLCNKPGAYCLKRAKDYGIPYKLIKSDDFDGSREEFDKLLIHELNEYHVELVCLAGYMRYVSPHFLSAFPNRVMNIHPALLPSFPGMHGYKDAIKYGVKISGCTVHFVDEMADHGPIIIQKALEVNYEDTEESLKERGLELEHQAFPEAIKLYCEGKLEIIGRKVRIKKSHS